MAAFELLTGDALAMLKTLPHDSVHCVVTSPPYWGLRDYGVDGQLGLEASPEIWVDRLVEVFDEVRRVLRHDGTAWVNLGDSYAQGGRGDQGLHVGLSGSRNNQNQSRQARKEMDRLRSSTRAPEGATWGPGEFPARAQARGRGVGCDGLKPKDLLGQPWMFAFAARAAGWYLRSDIVWAKPNPMPESIADRPTKSHEYVFLLSKSERYFYDADAIREPYKPESVARRAYPDQNTGERIGSLKPGAAKAMPKGEHRGGAEIRNAALYGPNPAGRNRRTVWTINTARFDEAHFATFPEELVEPCIMAGTSEGGCCQACGTPRRRRMAPAVEVEGGRASGNHKRKVAKNGERSRTNTHMGSSVPWKEVSRETIGWEASCSCLCRRCAASGITMIGCPDCGSSGRPATIPCTVLDPFSGSATTGAVALRLGRNYQGIELSAKYQEEIARPRLLAVQAQGQLQFDSTAIDTRDLVDGQPDPRQLPMFTNEDP